MNEELKKAYEIPSLKINVNFYSFIKRFFDIIIGLIGTIILFPILIVVKIKYIKNKDFYPIIFKQIRIGKNGEPFQLYKFRTMVPNADKILKELMENDEEIKEEYTKYKKLEHDPRVTKTGDKIRRLSIDEVPQFINILLGDMSVVGPRPYLPREVKDMKNYYNDIITTKPGLTGYWQISGRNNNSFDERLEKDIYYIKNKSLKFDIKIFFKTILKVIIKEGAK